MFLSEFKITKPNTNLKSHLTSVIVSNYSKEIFNEVQHSVNEFVKLKTNVENINKLLLETTEIEISNKILLEAKSNLILYCNYVSKLVKKLSIIDSYESKRSLSEFDGIFTYYDILVGTEYKEGLQYDLIVSIYNLAVTYFNLGVNLKYKVFESHGIVEDLIKEAMRDFQNCAAYLSLIKLKLREIGKVNNHLCDFNDFVLNFKISLAKAESQSLVQLLSEVKGMDEELNIALCKGTFESFSNLEKYLEIDLFSDINIYNTKTMCEYYSNLYQAIWLNKFSIKIFKDFEKTGLNYGSGITILKFALETLNRNQKICSSPLKSTLRYLIYNEYWLYQISNECELRIANNNRLYHQPVLEIKYVLPKMNIDSKIMVKEIPVQDDLENFVPDLFKQLEPIQQTILMKKIKQILAERVNQINEKFISEESISKFKENIINFNVGEFNFLINDAFDINCQIEVNSLLHKKIKELKSKEGEAYLNKSVIKIRYNSDTILSGISSIRNKMILEEKEDSELRIKFSTDEKAKLYKLDYSKIQASQDINKILLEHLDKLEATIKQAKEVDKQTISKISSLLVEPKVRISKVSDAPLISSIKVLTNYKIEELNQILEIIDSTKQKKSQAIEAFMKIPEWLDLLTSINELKSLVANSQTEKDSLKTLAYSLSDINLSSLNHDNFEQNKEIIIKEIFSGTEFSNVINSLKIISEKIELSKLNIINKCENLKQFLFKTDSGQKENDLKKLAIFNFDNKDVKEVKETFENTCNLFFEIMKLMKFSDGFYLEQTTKLRLLERKCVQFLIDRYIEKDCFLNIYNNNGIMNKTLGCSSRVNELNYRLVELDCDKPDHSDPNQNPIVNMTTTFSFKKTK